MSGKSAWTKARKEANERADKERKARKEVREGNNAHRATQNKARRAQGEPTPWESAKAARAARRAHLHSAHAEAHAETVTDGIEIKPKSRPAKKARAAK